MSLPSDRGQGAPAHHGFLERTKVRAHFPTALQQDLQKVGRAAKDVRLEMRHRLHLQIGIADAAVEYGGAKGAGGGVQQPGAGRQVIGEAGGANGARAHASGRQRARAAPEVMDVALRLTDRPGGPKQMRHGARRSRVQAAERRMRSLRFD